MVLKKRGYFFVLDAVLGLFILVIGIFLISSSYINVPRTTQVGLLSDDLLNFLSNTKIKNLNSQYAGVGGDLWNSGLITDSDNSLLQQVGEFYATSNVDIADSFISNVTHGVIPEQFRYEVWIKGDIIYPINQTEEHIKSKNNTGLMLTSKKITFGIINKTTSSIFGPYKAEVYVWEK